MNLQQLLKTYFIENKLMQLATVGTDGKPWLCNLYFVTDEDNNIYWTSARKQQHSKEIHGNSAAAVTIVHDAEHKQALQITGEASEVSLEDAKRIDELYSAKFGHKDRLTEIKANLPEGRAYWVVKPDQIFFWDEVIFPDAPKQEFNLET
jgi:uncharacterized protein YhbP (UPF0306 family)